MFADFEVYGSAMGLNACCLYGGAPYHSQESNLKRGVDIVIGTPGRIKVNFYFSNTCLDTCSGFSFFSM